MKKILGILIGLILVAGVAMAAPDVDVQYGEDWTVSATMSVASDNTTVTLTLPAGATGRRSRGNAWLKVPTIDSGTVSVQCSYDGTNFFTVWGMGASAPVAYTTGATTGGIVMVLPPGISACSKLKVVTGAEQTADRAFTAFGD